ncbi:hypothetical protein GCM10019016_043780 [Streptomyces prasinosporus]|uniref:Serine/threonine protein kinase n=1 Tax=Streptomyces prasinosporus TaxID=68256 RepID=A0ABP6TS41_9ACTN
MPGTPPRRRGATALLLGTAALSGLVAGACAGYLVQADRAPTPLPPLSQPVLPQATGPGPEPLPAAQDRQVRVGGDLRKLLLKKPVGAKAADRLPAPGGWMDIAAYAGDFTEPGDKFSSLVSNEFRRAAVVGWRNGTSFTVNIRLVQFRQEDSLAAIDSVGNHQEWAESAPGVRSWGIPGTGDGMAYVHTRPYAEPGYAPVYRAEAHASRGDVAMEIWAYGDRPISRKAIMDLAERQMERL